MTRREDRTPSYRDDCDAALARADALQRDLAAQEAEIAALRQRLARTESERDRLAAALPPPEPTSRRASLDDDEPMSAGAIMMLGVAAIVVLFALVMGWSHR